MWLSSSNIDLPKTKPVRPPTVRYQHQPWSRRFILAREAKLNGARLLRYRQRRKTLVTAFWCLAVSIAVIAVALLITPS
jgi:hypothetical protein